jgi:uncharacterized protein (DUF58 family)
MSFWKSLFTRTKANAASKDAAYSVASRATEVDLQGLIKLRFKSPHVSLSSQKKSFSSLSGNFSSPFKGRGLNFDEVRPYQPGDDIRNIDWNVTARTDKVHTKVFKEERERPVFIIVDLNDSMFFGSRNCLKSVTAAKAAALIAWAGADQSNRVGGLIFDENSHVEIRPKGGHQGVLRFLKLLTDFHQQHQQANNTPTATALDSAHLFARLQKLIHPGSIVLYISDFMNKDPMMFRHLQYLARHNDLLLTQIYDELETHLPPAGFYGISDGEQYQLLNTSDKTLRLSYQQHFEEESQQLSHFCMQHQIHLIQLATHHKVAEQFMATLGKHALVRRVARSRH